MNYTIYTILRINLIIFIFTLISYCGDSNGKDGGISEVMDTYIDKTPIDTIIDINQRDHQPDSINYRCDEEPECVSNREEILTRLNNIREGNCGPNSLTMDGGLNLAAQEKSNAMASSDDIEAGAPLEERLQRYDIRSESEWEYFAGPFSINQMFDALTANSDRMNRYILNCNFSKIGIGITPDPRHPAYNWFDIILIVPLP